MASVYALHCSVCKQYFETRKDWRVHLLQPQHQNQARKDCRSWNSKKVKKCVLAAFGNLPIATEKVLNSFTVVAGRDTIVTDFVWSESRPTVGLIQFESKAKVKEILKILGQPELQVDDEHLIQFKKVSDFLELEWDDLVAEIERGICSTSTENSLIKTEASENGQEEEDGDGDDHNDDDAEEMDVDVKPDINRLNAEGGDDSDRLPDERLNVPVSPSFFIDRNNIIPKVEPVDEEEIEETSSAPDTPPIPRKNASSRGGANTREKSSVSSTLEFCISSPPEEEEEMQEEPCQFKEQFDSILSEIAIPDEEYNLALDVMEKCRQIFSIKFPACKLYMFRHWYLKLRNNGTNELLFYIDFDGTLDGSHLQEEFYDKPFKLSQSEIEKLFNSKIGRGILPGVEAITKEEQIKKFEQRAYQFIHNPSGLKFSIVADSLFKTETQTCRLFNFLLDSDPRARPFFTLIFYWAKKCKVESSKPFFKFRHKSHAFAPEPSALEWMILLFLTHKKVVPSPREVLNRTHQKLVIFGKADIGFSNAKWVNPFPFSGTKTPPENSNEFFIHLVELAREFFNFYLELRTGSWILNTRDGEVIKKDDFVNKKPYVDWKTKLKPEEIGNIKSASAECKSTMVNLDKSVIYMIHPIFCRWSIMFASGTFQIGTDFKMACSAEVINQALKREGEWAEAEDENFLMKMFRSNPIRRVERMAYQLPFLPDAIMAKIEKRSGNRGLKMQKKEHSHEENFAGLNKVLTNRKTKFKMKKRRRRMRV
ncbi:unnamed protein product [Orchesella dallaii]|uniref:C2H2-type domain-containing protein n=1 Tax=Orchesella dallaii TaxID=48710 RepID=A0ABP1R6E1_9HEXA